MIDDDDDVRRGRDRPIAVIFEAAWRRWPWCSAGCWASRRWRGSTGPPGTPRGGPWPRCRCSGCSAGLALAGRAAGGIKRFRRGAIPARGGLARPRADLAGGGRRRGDALPGRHPGRAEPLARPWPGLAVASLLFGLLHPITPTYVAIAALLGAYLGAVWLATGNLLTVIVAHALYDFVALVICPRPADGARVGLMERLGREGDFLASGGYAHGIGRSTRRGGRARPRGATTARGLGLGTGHVMRTRARTAWRRSLLGRLVLVVLGGPAATASRPRPCAGSSSPARPSIT